jgi:hypothetical protein
MLCLLASLLTLSRLVVSVLYHNVIKVYNFYLLPSGCIPLFCMDLRTNSDYFPIQHKQTIPIQSWRDPEGCRRLRIPEFLDNRHMKITSLSALHTDRLYPYPPPPRRYPWYLFLLESEWAPESYWGRKDYVGDK